MRESAKAGDRLLVFVGVFGVLVMASALVVALRGPQAGAETTVRTDAQIDLSEFSSTGDLVVPGRGSPASGHQQRTVAHKDDHH